MKAFADQQQVIPFCHGKSYLRYSRKATPFVIAVLNLNDIDTLDEDLICSPCLGSLALPFCISHHTHVYTYIYIYIYTYIQSYIQTSQCGSNPKCSRENEAKTSPISPMRPVKAMAASTSVKVDSTNMYQHVPTVCRPGWLNMIISTPKRNFLLGGLGIFNHFEPGGWSGQIFGETFVEGCTRWACSVEPL